MITHISTRLVQHRSKNFNFRWLYLLTPAGVYFIWKTNTPAGLKLAYTLLVFPLLTLKFSLLLMIVFAAFLPPIDMSIGSREDRTLLNPEGHYSVTFLKTGHETNGEYELVRVELEPGGGNIWHYHKTFEEQFTVLEGTMLIGMNGDERVLQKGETVTAGREDIHFFKNPTAEKAVLLVKASPARGLEKTIRVGYGLANDGLLKEDMPENFWHLPLMLAYSESYFAEIPAVVQETLVSSLAKIAQWKGEDRDLYKYFQ